PAWSARSCCSSLRSHECHRAGGGGQLVSRRRGGAAPGPMARSAALERRLDMARLTILLALAAALLAASAHGETSNYTGWLVMMPTDMRDGGTEQIPATILKPPGDGPFAAVVVLHDCSGLSARSSGAPMRWATLLAGQGYVAIVPDSFS